MADPDKSRIKADSDAPPSLSVSTLATASRALGANTRMMQILVFINTKSGQQQAANIIHQFKYWKAKVAVNLKSGIYLVSFNFQ